MTLDHLTLTQGATALVSFVGSIAFISFAEEKIKNLFGNLKKLIQKI